MPKCCGRLDQPEGASPRFLSASNLHAIISGTEIRATGAMRMNRRQFGLSVWTSLAGMGVVPTLLTAAPTPKSKITWQKTLRAARDAAVDQNRPLLLVFGATWCTFCHKLHRETFTDRNLAAFIEREFICVALDFDQDTKVVEVLEVEQLPCTIVLSPEADLLLRYVGFAKPDTYRKKLDSALEKRAEIQVTNGTSPRRR